jgi:DNA (cytosine-5)-methyltransferase 1
MKFFDAFSGIGGFHLGIKQAHPDWECVGFSEIDKYAPMVYQKHFPMVKNYGDITKMDRLPEGTGIFCGGFPCQAFSIAGKRRGFSDTRGTLFFEIARLCEISKPKMLFLENVKGLLNHDGGKTFRTIIIRLTELGYCIEWQVLNSKNFGVPQNRERIFIIGYLGGEPERKVFPIGKDDKLSAEGLQEPENCFSALTATDYKGVSKQRSNCVAVAPEMSDGVFPSLNTAQGGRRQPKIVIPVLTPNRMVKRQNGRRFKEDGEPAFTLNSQDRHGVCLENRKIRRLTPLECERLQGFPDNWTEGISDSQRYKCIGNAVTVNVIREIAKRL